MSGDRPDRETTDPEIEWTPLDGAGLSGAAEAQGSTDVRPARFMTLTEEPGEAVQHSIDMLRDVEVELTVVLGTTKMQIKHILGLRPGSVVELNRLAGEPVDILINKTLIARGEVVVVDEKFAIRVIEIVPPERRLANP